MASKGANTARNSQGGDLGSIPHRHMAEAEGPLPLVLAMLDPADTPRRLRMRASGPALYDLRFKGDACVVPQATAAAVCLGDYQLAHLALTPLDLPAMNRAFLQVRLGQARREIHRPH